MTPMFRMCGVLLVSGIIALACSSESKLGEECGESGVGEGECESGGICGKDSAGTLLCLKVGIEQAQCGANEECNGVEGTNIKGCRPASSSGGKK